MNFEVNVEFDASSIDSVVNMQVSKLAENMEAVMLTLESVAVPLASVDLGQLRGQRETNVDVNNTEIVGSLAFNAEHAVYVHQGTGIYATDGNGRKTSWIYKDRKGNVVRTQGQKANPFLEDAVDKIFNDISGILAR